MKSDVLILLSGKIACASPTASFFLEMLCSIFISLKASFYPSAFLYCPIFCMVQLNKIIFSIKDALILAGVITLTALKCEIFEVKKYSFTLQETRRKAITCLYPNPE